MTVDDEIRAALTGYDPPRRAHFDARQAVAAAARRRTRRRVAGALGSAAVVLAVIVAVATLHPDPRADRTRTGGPPTTTPPPDTIRPGEDPHEVRARAQAHDLLASFTPPAAAVAVSGSDDPYVAGALPSWTPNAVDRHQSWVMDGSVYSVYRALAAHLPPGAHLASVGYAKGVTPPTPVPGTIGGSVRADLAPTPGITEASISVDDVAGSADVDASTMSISLIGISGGRTAIRADAWADWSVTRPAGPRIGAGEQLLTITTTFRPPTVPKARTLRTTVTDGDRIDTVARALDRAPLPVPRQPVETCRQRGRLLPLSGGLNSSFLLGPPRGEASSPAADSGDCAREVPRCLPSDDNETEVLRFSSGPTAPPDVTATLEFSGPDGPVPCDHVVILRMRGQSPVVLQGGTDALSSALWYIQPRLVPLTPPSTRPAPR